MRRRLPLLALALALAAGPARAQAPGETEARRAEVMRLDAARAELAAQRRTLEAELDRLAGEIARLKAEHAQGTPLFGDPELDRRLKRSKELSDRIDDLGRREDETTRRLKEAAIGLLALYDARMLRARATLEAAKGEEARRDAVEAIGSIEQSRREVQAGLDRLSPKTGAASVPRVEATDDPEELRAQADLLRDSRDRLARRLAELDRRAGELRRQRALEREMQGFVSETRFFDEGDRSTSRVAVSQAGTTTPESGGSGRTDGTNADPAAGGSAPPPGGTSGDSYGEGATTPPTAETGGTTGDVLFRLERTPSRTEASAAIDDLFRTDEGANLDEIEGRMKEIRGLIERLDRRATSLEKRADALDR